jgi:ribokinase
MSKSRNQEATVVVVGSVNLDLVVRVPSLPREGETVAGGEFQRAFGGKGANQAAAAARLGATVWLVGKTGDDSDGQLARDDLAAFGVLTDDTLGYSSSPTGVAAIVVDHEARNMIAVASGANHDLSGSDVVAALKTILTDDAVVLANLEIRDEAVTAAAEYATRRGWPFLLNPAPARELPQRLIESCQVLTPNREEARTLGSVESLLAAGAAAVLVTLGADGSELHRAGTPSRRFDSVPVEAVDTTGAGDAFNGALAWAIATHHDIEDAAQLATAAGALACRGLGARTTLPDYEELSRAADL